ncbi:hypothetical protein COU19_00425 [Candidatus Kaiserbacteria bacterium CG10_big_fil_rev_8_21_14_0_10_56_12]|uniref:EamA domain-containing protein n=1 Tax=Candidatus Kaiserbacteria bacterium CG10_big_fil_rev_8_21_14_0_10_56_12 TaxID=1974611 RepID=A0A2H0UAI9_9BACT|nr:MAG: hypothetical protein COU19_00425 [Candidatus Kaiserbacteria bacterium CG10_big_fil_rev_8_21_14_0_10_56_12]
MGAFFLSIPWFVPILSKVLFGNVVASYLHKRMSLGSRLPQKLVLQFTCTSVLAIGAAWVLDQLVFNSTTAPVVALGVANAWACHAQWKAHAVSLSRTSFFMFGNGALAMLLTTVFLGEVQIVTTTLLMGIILYFGAALLLTREDLRATGTVPEELDPIQARQFYRAVATYTLVWGVANFVVKYLSVEEVPVGTYLSAWYSGSLLGAWILKWRVEGLRFDWELARSDMPRIEVLSIAIIANLASIYWAHWLAPQLVIFPLLLVADLVAPAVVGFVFFKEHRNFSRAQLCFLGIAIIGGILVAFTQT